MSAATPHPMPTPTPPLSPVLALRQGIRQAEADKQQATHAAQASQEAASGSDAVAVQEGRQQQ